MLLREFLGMRDERQTACDGDAGSGRSSARTARGRTSTGGRPISRRRSRPTSRCASPATRPTREHMRRAAGVRPRRRRRRARRASSRTCGSRCSACGRGSGVPVLPPELMLLPARGRRYRSTTSRCWARQTVVALRSCCSSRPVAAVPFALDELRTGREPRGARAARSPGARALRRCSTAALRLYDRRPLALAPREPRSGAGRALDRRPPGGRRLLGRDPAAVGVVADRAARLRGYPIDHPVIVQALDGLDGFTIEDELGRRARGLPVAGLGHGARAGRARRRRSSRRRRSGRARAPTGSLDEQVTVRGDWAVRRPTLEPGGWAFEFANDYYPDVDDTAEVVLALAARAGVDGPRVAPRGISWLEGMQSRRRRLGRVRRRQHEPASARAPVLRLRRGDRSSERRRHGARPRDARRSRDWPGRPQARARNRVPAAPSRSPTDRGSGAGAQTTSTAPAPLSRRSPRAGSRRSESVRRAVRWLEPRFRTPTAGSGEDLRSYDDPSWRGRGSSTASQTAWALLALHAAGESGPVVEGAVRFLVETQRADGSWDEPWYTGTGFPGDFYINYHLYRLVFPVMALGRVLAGRRARNGRAVVTRVRADSARGRRRRPPRRVACRSLGMGAARARIAAARALAIEDVRGLAVAGVCAGGCAASSRPATWCSPASFAARAATLCRSREARCSRRRCAGVGCAFISVPIASVERLSGPAERRSSRADGVIAVDMESAWLADGAAGRPLAVVRVVVESPERELSTSGPRRTGLAHCSPCDARHPRFEEWAAALGPKRILLAAPRVVLRGGRAGDRDRRARARAARGAGVRAQADRSQRARRLRARAPRRGLRRRARRGPGRRDRGLLRPRRLAGGEARRPGAVARRDRRDVPAREQGARRGAALRGGGEHDLPDRARGPRGGRGHLRRGAGARRCSSRTSTTPHGSRRRIRAALPTSRRPRSRWTRPPQIVDGCGALPGPAGARLRRHLLRDENRQDAVRAIAQRLRRRARRRLAELVELAAARRGGGTRGNARLPRRRRDRGRRRVARGREDGRRSRPALPRRRRSSTGSSPRSTRWAAPRSRSGSTTTESLRFRLPVERGGPMSVPLRQSVKIGGYLLAQKLRRREHFPLLVELEPLFQCNLACSFCGKIQHPEHILSSGCRSSRRLPRSRSAARRWSRSPAASRSSIPRSTCSRRS